MTALELHPILFPLPTLHPTPPHPSKMRGFNNGFKTWGLFFPCRFWDFLDWSKTLIRVEGQVGGVLVTGPVPTKTVPTQSPVPTCPRKWKVILCQCVCVLFIYATIVAIIHGGEMVCCGGDKKIDVSNFFCGTRLLEVKCLSTQYTYDTSGPRACTISEVNRVIYGHPYTRAVTLSCSVMGYASQARRAGLMNNELAR